MLALSAVVGRLQRILVTFVDRGRAAGKGQGSCISGGHRGYERGEVYRAERAVAAIDRGETVVAQRQKRGIQGIFERVRARQVSGPEIYLSS